MKSQEKRFKLIKKYCKNINYKPSEKEIDEAYDYLSYCLICNKSIKKLEPYSHGFEGNIHRFGCSKIKRGLGVIYKLGVIILLFPIVLVIFPFALIYYSIKYLFTGKWELK